MADDWQFSEMPIYVQIFRNNGQILKLSKLPRNYQLDLSDLAKGWYHCRLVQGSQLVGQAFLVKQ